LDISSKLTGIALLALTWRVSSVQNFDDARAPVNDLAPSSSPRQFGRIEAMAVRNA
jgi:hypothetical protein